MRHDRWHQLQKKDFAPTMEPFSFLRDLLIVFAIAAAVVFLLHRVSVPSVVGLLVAGVLIGPYGLIIVRTRYLSEVAALRLLGANVIIPEEFETSVEIFAQVLREYEVPRNLIVNLIERIRSEQYEVLRDTKVPATRVVLPHANILEKMEIKSCWLRCGSPAEGRSLRDLKLRSVTGATVLAVRRGRELFFNPDPDFRFQADDIVILTGERSRVERAMDLLDPVLQGKTNRRRRVR